MKIEKILPLALLLTITVSAQDTARYNPRMAECIEFLYSNMSLPDSVDYPRSYWKEQVRLALRARREMSWGDSVPRWEFLNYVLPVRVNNESLDNARQVIYRDLAPRLRGLTMQQAALEVNHWCHEHVSYRPSDARTSSPLATMANTIGRCGEESTFTVAALRSVGIPARQVYCPRWAHTDDNHAWVEVWICNPSSPTGSWHFMGACEPEETLDRGWFNWAASRSMLVRTYDQEGNEIQTTSTYAPTKTLNVHVADETGKPVSDATVDFRLYNYSEFFPLHTTVTDNNGNAHFTTGYGDLQIWVSKDGKYGVQKADAYTTNVTIVPCYSAGTSWICEYDWHVPRTQLPEPDRSVVDTVSHNGRRLLAEDKIRTAYQQRTFYNGKDSLLRQARSNWPVIRNFINQGHPNTDLVIRGLSEKDLRDVTADVLRDACLMPQAGLQSGGVRVSTEPLRPYVAFIQKNLPPMTSSQWIEWVRNNITIDETANFRQLPMSVTGIYHTRRCDSANRELFTVAGARALGLRAELNPVGKAVVQGLSLATEGTAVPMGTLMLDVPADVMYCHGYTVSRMVNGRPMSLDYADDDPTVTHKFRQGLQLPAGDYLITTGTRLAGGDVLTRSLMFTLPADRTITVPVIFRQSEHSVTGDLQLDDSEKNSCATSIQSAQ